MTKTIKASKRLAEKLKKFLIKKNYLSREYTLGKGATYILFPLTSKAKTSEILKEFPSVSIEERNLQKFESKSIGNLKNMLKGVIPDKELKNIKRSFDIVGDIAILEIPPELEKLEKSIAWALKRNLPGINVVAKKASTVSGKYRIRKIIPIIGKRTETIHKEAGIILHLDLNKVYFSPRLGTERLRIASQVKPKEKILVMFAGIGPFAFTILNKQRSAKIWAIELNPDAIKYMKENLGPNKAKYQVIPIKGDVKKEVPKLKQEFDRIIMILPHLAQEYLDLAFSKSKKNTIIHFYQICKETELKDKKYFIKEQAKEAKKKIKILKIVKTGTYGPEIYRYCFDIEVLG